MAGIFRSVMSSLLFLLHYTSVTTGSSTQCTTVNTIQTNISVNKTSSNFEVNCNSKCGKQHYFDVTLVTSSPMTLRNNTIHGSCSNHSSLHARLEYTTSSSTSSGVHSSLVITPGLPGIYLVSCINYVVHAESQSQYAIYSKTEFVVIREKEVISSQTTIVSSTDIPEPTPSRVPPSPSLCDCREEPWISDSAVSADPSSSFGGWPLLPTTSSETSSQLQATTITTVFNCTAIIQSTSAETISSSISMEMDNSMPPTTTTSFISIEKSTGIGTLVATLVVVIVLLLCTVVITTYCTAKYMKRKESQDIDSGQDNEFSTGHTGYLKRTLSANNPIVLVVSNQGSTDGDICLAS